MSLYLPFTASPVCDSGTATDWELSYPTVLQGWKLDSKAQTPIFPVIMRPDHPLPPPVIAEPVAGPSELKKGEKDDKAKKASKKAEKAAKKAEKIAKKSNKSKATQEASLSPPTRARMVKIDPTQWQAQHLREPDLQNLPDTSSVKTKAVKEQASASESKPKEAKKAAKTPVPVVEASSDDASSEQKDEAPQLQLSAPEPIAPASKHSPTVTAAMETAYDDEASIAERKANLDMVARLLGGLPKDLEPVQEAISLQVGESDSEEDSEGDDRASVEKEDVPNTVAEVQAVNEDVEMENRPAEEVRAEVVLSDKTVRAAAELLSTVHAVVPEVEDDSEPNKEAEADEELSEDGDVTDVSPDSPLDIEGSSEVQEAVLPSTSTGLADVQMQSLTDMFKPQETAGEFETLPTTL